MSSISDRKAVSKVLLGVVIVIVVVGAIGGLLAFQALSPTSAPPPAARPAAAVKSFTLTVQDKQQPWTFVGAGGAVNPDIRVKVGDRVEVTLKNDGIIVHDFRIEALGITIHDVKVGETKKIAFTAEKTGTFEYICEVPGHKELGMKGKFIVEAG